MNPYGWRPETYAPREHPSANHALLLALVGNFCLGALTGVPAILMGRSAVRAIAQEPQRWRGANTAKFAIALGWLSVLETAFVVTFSVAHGYVSGALGILLGLAGLAAVVASRRLRAAPLALAVPFAGVLFGGALGLATAFTRDAAIKASCDDARAAYPVSLKKEDFAAARGNVDAIEQSCKSHDDAPAMRREIGSKSAAVTKRREKEAKDREAKALAEKEKNAVDTFPAKSKSITITLKSAQSNVWAGKWEDAKSDLDSAQSDLDDFKGTSVEQSKDYVALTTQIATRRKAIQPHLDAIEAKRAKEAAAAALLDAVRGPQPTNSAWDGSIACIESYLKSVMNDPDSYQHVSTTIPVAQGEYWVATSTFRGKNAFGALVVNTKEFYIQQNEVVKVGDVQ